MIYICPLGSSSYQIPVYLQSLIRRVPLPNFLPILKVPTNLSPEGSIIIPDPCLFPINHSPSYFLPFEYV